MFASNLKVATRVFRRDKWYSLLNVAGLALGMACFVLLMTWVRDEVGWDRFHENFRDLYRVQSSLISQPGALAPHLKANYPEIVNTARFLINYVPQSVQYQEKVFDEAGFGFADAALFEMFTIPFVSGNPAAAFPGPDSVVLTETTARKYFGNDDPVGRILTVDGRFEVRVTGVVKDRPRNSDLRFDILADFQFHANYRKDLNTSWNSHNYMTYVQLKKGLAAQTLVPKIAHLVMDRNRAMTTPLTLNPLARIHLYDDGAIVYVRLFSLVALFILVIAGCNFVNLTTARSGNRAKEIAVRKTVGAVKPQLIRQFLSEAVFLSLCSLPLAAVFVALALPSFNAVAGTGYGLGFLLSPRILLSLFGASVAVGLIAGGYPALHLSSLRPVRLFRSGSFPARRTSGLAGFRKILIALQFSISIVLLVATLYVHKQVAFIRTYDLGIRRDNLVILPVKAQLLKQRGALINALTSRPGILSATFASSFPSDKTQITGSNIGWEGKDPASKPSWQYVATDDRYLETLGIRLVEGRNFPEYTPVDAPAPYFIVNEKAAAQMGIAHPVGTRFSVFGAKGTLIGIVKDYHFKLLREDVGPLVLCMTPWDMRYILIRIQPEKAGMPSLLAGIKEVWDEYAPGMPFSYDFFDTAYDRNYQTEQRMGSEFRVFTFLGIFISCLGLVGLTAYVVERKRKEIGIRKVLGATLPRILAHLNREFLGPVLLSNLIAWPAAYWAMKMWLRGFVFHANLSLGIFLAAAGATLAVALITVSFQSVRAAQENPARSLKTE
jgi:putative ABC transport system permease protein